jgi:hypothetical protein
MAFVLKKKFPWNRKRNKGEPVGDIEGNPWGRVGPRDYSPGPPTDPYVRN